MLCFEKGFFGRGMDAKEGRISEVGWGMGGWCMFFLGGGFFENGFV